MPHVCLYLQVLSLSTHFSPLLCYATCLSISTDFIIVHIFLTSLMLCHMSVYIYRFYLCPHISHFSYAMPHVCLYLQVLSLSTHFSPLLRYATCPSIKKDTSLSSLRNIKTTTVSHGTDTCRHVQFFCINVKEMTPSCKHH